MYRIFFNFAKSCVLSCLSKVDNIKKSEVKRLALIYDIEMGGLKMLDIQSMICAKRIICLKKLLEDYSSPWKVILDKLLLPIGGRFVLHCNFQTSKLKINLPAFYKECFDAWSEVNGKTPSCYENIINEIIWNNKFLCYDNKTIYRRDIANSGLVKIRDLISANKSFSCDFSLPCWRMWQNCTFLSYLPIRQHVLFFAIFVVACISGHIFCFWYELP